MATGRMQNSGHLLNTNTSDLHSLTSAKISLAKSCDRQADSIAIHLIYLLLARPGGSATRVTMWGRRRRLQF